MRDTTLPRSSSSDRESKSDNEKFASNYYARLCIAQQKYRSTVQCTYNIIL